MFYGNLRPRYARICFAIPVETKIAPRFESVILAALVGVDQRFGLPETVFTGFILYNRSFAIAAEWAMFDVNTQDVRRFFADVWTRRLLPVQLDALQKKALRIIEAHPEYQPYLADVERYLDRNWTPEAGQTNPFLHLSLHLSIQEQVAIDQPFGIAAIHRQLCGRYSDDWAAAEHEMMEALAETIWQAQRYGQGLDVNAYMTRLRRLVDLGAEDEVRLSPHEVAQAAEGSKGE